MTTNNNDAPNFEAVVKRFADAEDAFNRVRSHLETLSSFKDSE